MYLAPRNPVNSICPRRPVSGLSRVRYLTRASKHSPVHSPRAKFLTPIAICFHRFSMLPSPLDYEIQDKFEREKGPPQISGHPGRFRWPSRSLAIPYLLRSQ